MDIPLEQGTIRTLGILVAATLMSGIIGLMRAWIGQLAILALNISLWSLFSLAGNAVVALVNDMYRRILFLASCGMAADPAGCSETSRVMDRILIDPSSPGQVHLFFGVILALTTLVSYLFVIRFGRIARPLSRKLLGALLGVVNGLILCYLLLPSTLQQLPLPLPEAWTVEGFPQIPGLVAGTADVCQVSLPFGFLMFLVLFVIVAVRFIRTPKREEA